MLEGRIAACVAAGISKDRLIADPGIGFGKTLEHNLLLLRHLERFVALGRPVVLGASRKRFLGAILDAASDDRLFGTVATTVMGAQAGAAVFRVHDVKPNVEALRVTEAVRTAGDA